MAPGNVELHVEPADARVEVDGVELGLASDFDGSRLDTWMPAPCTTRSIRPYAAAMAATARSTSASTVTSTAW